MGFKPFAEDVDVSPNQQSVHSNATVTASGSSVFTTYGVKEVSLVVNVTIAPTGTTPTITFTIQEVDPGDQTTTLGTSASGAAINSTGTQEIVLRTTSVGALKVSWVVTGAGASFTGLYSTLTGKETTAVSGVDASGTERTVLTDSSGRVAVSTKTPLTATAPTAVSVGTSSGLAVAANANRKGLILTNTSNKSMSLSFDGNAAVLNSGITLVANGGTWVMDEYSFTTAAVNAIAGGTTMNLAVQEFTT